MGGTTIRQAHHKLTRSSQSMGVACFFMGQPKENYNFISDTYLESITEATVQFALKQIMGEPHIVAHNKPMARKIRHELRKNLPEHYQLFRLISQFAALSQIPAWVCMRPETFTFQSDSLGEKHYG